jgi:hypothetical protein
MEERLIRSAGVNKASNVAQVQTQRLVEIEARYNHDHLRSETAFEVI